MDNKKGDGMALHGGSVGRPEQNENAVHALRNLFNRNLFNRNRAPYRPPSRGL